MIEKMTSINPEMLVWARKVSGVTLEEVMEKFGKDRINAWESGNDHPTYSQLKNLCLLYRKPVAICFFPEPPKLKNPLGSFRTLPKTIIDNPSKEIIKLIDEARVYQLNLYELFDNVNPSNNNISKINLNSLDVISISYKLRSLLDVTLDEQKKIKKMEDALEFWRDKFYNIGIFVFKNSFNDDQISGLCLYDSEFPVIYINNSLSFSRQIFTLFHEMYHIISSTSGIDIRDDRDMIRNITNQEYSNIEKQCNRFAGEFLVPNDDLLKIINNKLIDDKLILHLSDLYSVSREVILRKLLDNKKITNDMYTEKIELFYQDYKRKKSIKSEKKESGGMYYNTQAAYIGRNYIKAAFSKYRNYKIDIYQLSKFLNMKVQSVSKLATLKGLGPI